MKICYSTFNIKSYKNTPTHHNSCVGVFFSAIIVFPKIIGLTWVECNQTIGDICTFIMAMPLGLSVVKELNDSISSNHQNQYT